VVVVAEEHQMKMKLQVAAVAVLAATFLPKGFLVQTLHH
jgi:hypothetical protein